jgi:hypothetical protein
MTGPSATAAGFSVTNQARARRLSAIARRSAIGPNRSMRRPIGVAPITAPAE